MTFLVPRTPLLRRLLHPPLVLRQLPHLRLVRLTIPELLRQAPHPRLVPLTILELPHRVPHPRLVLLPTLELPHRVPHPRLVLLTIQDLPHQVPPHLHLALLQAHLPQIHPLPHLLHRILIRTMPLIPTTLAPTPTAESTTPHLTPPRPPPWHTPSTSHRLLLGRSHVSDEGGRTISAGGRHSRNGWMTWSHSRKRKRLSYSFAYFCIHLFCFDVLDFLCSYVDFVSFLSCSQGRQEPTKRGREGEMSDAWTSHIPLWYTL